MYLPKLGSKTKNLGGIPIIKSGITKYLTIETYFYSGTVKTITFPMDVNICAIAIGGGGVITPWGYNGGGGGLGYSYRTLKKTDVLTYYVGSGGQSSWVKINDVTIAQGNPGYPIDGATSTGGTGFGDVAYSGSGAYNNWYYGEVAGYTSSAVSYEGYISAGSSNGVTFDGTYLINPAGNFGRGFIVGDTYNPNVPPLPGHVAILISSTDFVRTPFNYATYNSSK